MKGKFESPPSARVPIWVKWLASIALLGHFFAIFTAVTSPPPMSALPSPLVIKAFRHTLPYLHFVMLTNAYRFYAPEPGPTSLTWYRLEYQDQSVRWLELPRKEDFWLRMPYQRRLCIPMRLDNYMRMTPTGARVLDPSGQILVSSYVRYVARNYGRPDNPVADVQIYLVPHRIRAPDEVKVGVHEKDIRLYGAGPFGLSAQYLGAYAADGASKAPQENRDLQAQLSAITSFFLAGRILEQDVYPLLEKHKDADPWAVLEPLQLPTSIRLLLTQFPELLDPKTPHDWETIQRLVTSRDQLPNSP